MIAASRPPAKAAPTRISGRSGGIPNGSSVPSPPPPDAATLPAGRAVVGIVAGVFAVIGLLFLLHGLAWLIYYLLFPDGTYFWGFFVVAGVLFLFGALAGFLATRAFKRGSPPKPELAIDEAKRIRETVKSEHPEQTV